MITRRTVLKSSLLMLCPTIRLRPLTHDREGMLVAFADSGSIRSYKYDLVKPFRVGDLTYATDALHMVRACLSGTVEDGEIRTPDVEEAWRESWQPSERGWRPLELPDVGELRLSCGCGCPLCGNRRVSLGENYPSMDWLTGSDASDYDYDIDDNTMRDKSCRLCRGRRYEGPNVLDMGGVMMAYARLAPIAALPNVEWSVSRAGSQQPTWTGPPPHAIVFRSRDVEIEGVSMGVRKDAVT